MADKKFTESLFKSVLMAGMRDNFAVMRKARQQGKSHERSVAEILGQPPKWHQQPQPARTYTGAVHRLDNFDDKAICPHPSNIICGSKIIGQWFISRREGGQYEFVDRAEWERLKPLVPIYGERVGDRMVIYDRIIAEGRSGHGYRERIITDQELIDVGYRAEFRGKSIDQMIVDSIVPDKKWEVSFDKVVAHGEVWAVYYLNADNHIHILEQGPEEVKKPAKKRAKPVDFFPNKIDRIAKMPRYPGVWG